MAQLWDAFIQDYQNEIFDWSTRETLEIFWYYCQDGSKAVFKLLKENRKLRDKKIERLKKENNDLILANKGRKALTGAQFSCMEKLEKEKEWLITQLCKDWDQDAGTEKEDLRGFVIKEMQQALKRGGMNGCLERRI